MEPTDLIKCDTCKKQMTFELFQIHECISDSPEITIDEVDLNNILMLHPIMEEANRLLLRKSQDYNGEQFPDPARREYFPFGHQSYLHMIHTKVERLKSVVLQDKANFESAYDTILDLINYSCFYGAYLKEEESAPDSE